MGGKQMSVNNFDVLKEMSKRNMDIKMFPRDNLREAKREGKQTWVKIAVDDETVLRLFRNDKLVFALLIADGEQFSTLKAELEAQP
jgi:hypothetical protein